MRPAIQILDLVRKRMLDQIDALARTSSRIVCVTLEAVRSQYLRIAKRAQRRVDRVAAQRRTLRSDVRRHGSVTADNLVEVEQNADPLDTGTTWAIVIFILRPEMNQLAVPRSNS